MSHGQFVQQQIAAGAIQAAHDIGDGGLLTAVAEMILSGGIGAEIDCTAGDTAQAWAFGEDQGRYIVQVDNAQAFAARLKEQGVDGYRIGITTDDQILTVGADITISIEEMQTRHEGKLPQMMA